MIVMFSARRLKPGAWEQFRRAWDSGDAKPPGFQRAYHARNIRDEDEIISFGLFDMSEDEYRTWRGEQLEARSTSERQFEEAAELDPGQAPSKVIETAHRRAGTALLVVKVSQ